MNRRDVWRLFAVLISIALACGSCRSRQVPSGSKDVTTFSPGDSVDLTGYSAVEADYKAFRHEINTAYCTNSLPPDDAGAEAANGNCSPKTSLFYIEGISPARDSLLSHEQTTASSLSLNSTCGRRYEDIETELKRSSPITEPPYNRIPLPELVAIRAYTSSGSKMVNRILRTSDVSSLQNISGFVRSASSGLNKLPNYVGVVKRGICLNPADYPSLQKIVSHYEIGKKITEKAFVSASAGNSFEGMITFNISSKFGKSIKDLSGWPQENEVLFVPGSEFVVKNVRKTRVYEIDLDQVPTAAQANQ